MWDIYLGVLLSIAISGLAFALAYRLGQRLSQRTVDLVTTALVLVLVLYIRDLWNSLALAAYLPYSNLIVLGNWLVPAIAVLGGLAWHRLPGHFYRRTAWIGCMFLVAVYSLVHPLRGEAPVCSDRWENGVCLQSTNASCSAASAATLLRAYGIETTEQEMAELCLTRKEGTHWQGLYRGLKLKTEGTKWDVEVFGGVTIKDLRDKSEFGPIIITVGLPDDARISPVYREDLGWIPGVSHSVVLFKFWTMGMANIGDPSLVEGRENWFENDLKILWQGRGIRLVPRDKDGAHKQETNPVEYAAEVDVESPYSRQLATLQKSHASF